MNKCIFSIKFLSICAIISTHLHAMDNDLSKISVPEYFIGEAKKVPSQHGLGSEGSWSCGPNSLERFLMLSGFFRPHTQEDLEASLKKCPRSFGMPATLEGKITCAGIFGSSLYGISDSDGSYVLPCLGMVVALTPYVIEAINHYKGIGKVGPTPRWLAGYGNSLLNEMYSGDQIEVGQFIDEKEVLDKIKHELKYCRPVIVLLNFAPFMWHYVNIIAYENGYFKYLETSGSTYEYSEEGLLRNMDFIKDYATNALKNALKYPGWLLGVDIDRFNILYMRKK